MNRLSPEALALRARVRDFMQTKVSAEYIERTRNGLRLSKKEQEHWHSLLDAEGWLVNHWPEEWGGPGRTAVERFVFDYETALGPAHSAVRGEHARGCARPVDTARKPEQVGTCIATGARPCPTPWDWA